MNPDLSPPPPPSALAAAPAVAPPSHLWWGLGLLALALLVVAPGLGMGLHADDWFHVRPRGFGETMATFAGDWNDGARGRGGFYRPLVRLSFSLGTWCHGFRAAGHHLMNGVMFLAIVGAAWRGARWLAPGGGAWPAVVVGAVIVLNPVKNEALYWVSGRTDLLATALVAWGVVLAMRALALRCGASAAGALLLLAGGLMSKEIALGGCAALPLVAWMLAPATSRDWWGRRLLLLGPVVLGVLYMVWRSTVLGGLAGYRGDPAPLTQYAAALLRPISALAWPWQADGPAQFHPALGVLGLLGAAGALALRGLPRGAVCMLAGGLVCMAPLAFLTIDPNDGLRNLMMPLFFMALFVAGLFPAASVLRLPALVVLGLVALSLQSANLRIISQFLEAREANDAAVAVAWAAAEGAAPGAVVIAPEPPRQAQRRILDPGAALMMAVQAHWLAQPGSTSTDLVDVEVPRFALALEAPGRRVLLAHALQPWMEAPIHHLIFAGDSVRVLGLRPSGKELISAEKEPEMDFFLAKEEGVSFLVVSVLAEGRGSPMIRVEAGDGTVREQMGHYFREAGPAIGWMDTTADLTRPLPHRVTFEAGGSEMRLQRLSLRVYAVVDDNTE